MKKVAIYIFISAFLFGTMEVTLKMAGSELDSFQLTFIRFFIGGLLLLPFAIREIKCNKTVITFKDYMYLLLLGIVCIPLSMLFFQIGVMGANASTASVLICVNPLFTMVFAHFMTKDDKMNKIKVVAFMLGLLGILFMVSPWKLQEGNTAMGIFLVILGAVFFGLYTVMGKISIQKMGLYAQTSISFILGSLVLLVILLFMGRPVVLGVADNIWLVLYLGIFVTGLGYLFYFLAIKNSDATTGSIVFFVKPAIAPVMAVIILNDVITWNGYLGIALILFASYISIREKRKGKYEELQD
ncbi:DMT family transporter [Anaerovorax odorimutans]|uniref:DMT family transporter n=1 Tax=Anaerovorax odorimutans TaxID=109327 RepID=UPI000412D62B|nr:DMT family transporter [Anaerovorax odorimutans]